MALTIRDLYQQNISVMSSLSKSAAKIDETHVYEEANMELRKYMDMLIEKAIPATSRINNVEYYKAFYLIYYTELNIKIAREQICKDLCKFL